MKTLRSCTPDELRGKRVIVRTDFNVPMQDGEVTGDFRILKALPTIEYLRDAGARVILMSHIGGENGKTLALVATYLSRFMHVVFVSDIKSAETRHMIDTLHNGDVVLLENLRNDPGEKNNSHEFATLLASFGDIYVNDAFSASHREHASIVSLPKLLPAYAGLLMEEEIQGLQHALHPVHPFLFILGGAKFDTKLPLIKKFLTIADYIFVGGALAHSILKERGYEVGHSFIASPAPDVSDIATNPKIHIPSEVVVRNGDAVEVKQIREVTATDSIVDAGKGTIADIKQLIDKVSYVVWNGPLGAYEDGFDEGTQAVAELISRAKADSLVGGGDTLTAIHKMGVEDGFETISTAGGAMLEFLVQETLPGIEALG